ncbi:MAG: YbaK/EbsC family protein [Holophaga sp.]|jgi:prolyl-tRNA editing enzyme YbaK/EbsC (Cys-tRNA(Pro) deacylase)
MNETILHPEVAATLARYDMKHRVIECDQQYADTAAFCEHYDFPASAAANTIIVATKSDPVRYAACIVLPTTKLDANKCVRQLMGSRLSFASAEQTMALTGMQIGGVVAVGLPEDVPVYIDDAVFALPEVLMGGGNRSSKLRLEPQELLKMPHAQRVQGLGVAH